MEPWGVPNGQASQVNRRQYIRSGRAGIPARATLPRFLHLGARTMQQPTPRRPKSLTLGRRVVEIPIAATVVLAVPALAAWHFQSLLLFPSLGPTALMQVTSPEHRASRLYNTIAGHFGGIVAGAVSVWLFGLAAAPSIFDARAISAQRVGASLVAILVATALEILLDSSHPPAASSTLLISLGSFRPTAHDLLQIAIGVVATALAGEALRRLRLRSASGEADAPTVA
jgi:hypothetical protein